MLCTPRVAPLLAVFFASLAIGAFADERTARLPKVKHMIDTHIHLYDTGREGGVPWPPEDDKVLHKPHLPAEFNRVAKPAGVTGVVVVEASHLPADNRMVLDSVKGDPFYLGLVGNVDPYRGDFAEQIDRLRGDKRFVGVRARNSPGPIDYSDQRVMKSFRALAERGLTLDILGNGAGTKVIVQIDKLAREIPELRIVFDHVLGYNIDGEQPPADWMAAAARLAENDNVYCKISGLYQRCLQQPAPTGDLEHFTPVLDALWGMFGSERLIYGSNWPCTKHSGDYQSYVLLVNSYFAQKGQEACERYFWENANEAYQLGLK